MKVTDLIAEVKEGADLFEFEYNGRYGNLEHYYYPETKTYKWLLSFEDREQYFDTAEDLMNAPFFDGKSLLDVADDIMEV